MEVEGWRGHRRVREVNEYTGCAGQSTSEVNMNGKGCSPHSMNTDPFFSSTRNLAGTVLGTGWQPLGIISNKNSSEECELLAMVRAIMVMVTLHPHRPLPC